MLPHAREARTANAFIAFAIVTLAASLALAQATPTPAWNDPLDELAAWKVAPSDGVEATITAVDGQAGKCMRLDYNFKTGGGFVVVKRPVQITLGPDYQFAFQIRADSTDQNLEFKIQKGEDVWWMNRRAFEFPKDWTRLIYRKRHLTFAWGPSGPDKPLQTIDSLEFAVSSVTGGKGSVCFDSLSYESLPEPKPYDGTPKVTVSSLHPAGEDPTVWRDGKINWRSDELDSTAHLMLDFGRFRDLGGVKLMWDATDYATDYELQLSNDGENWTTVKHVQGGNGGTDFVPLPDGGGSRLLLAVTKTSRDKGVWLKSIEVKPVEWSNSPNDFFASVAGETPRGWWPRYCYNQQPYWTIVGVPNDNDEALIDTDAAIELNRRGPRIEPFLHVGGKLITWADVQSKVSLQEDYLPIPTVTWTASDLQLKTTAMGVGEAGSSRTLVQYRITNNGKSQLKGSLFLALRPFQVLPPWQALNIVGGVAPVSWIGSREDLVEWDRGWVKPLTKAAGFGATSFDAGDIIEHVAAGKLPAINSAKDPHDKLSSAAWRYDFDLAPGAEKRIILNFSSYPLNDKGDSARSDAQIADYWDSSLQALVEKWIAALNVVKLSLPPSAKRLEDTFRTTQAYILINADGPSIQPGSRTYERSWIRDGALTSTSLLYTGHTEMVKSFIDWYLPNIYPSGKVPCVVDKRGPDPVPEYDSQGQLIYLLWRYYQFTGDRDVLARYLPTVETDVAYIEELRAQRMTSEYRDGPPEKRVKFGLVPESISHEGYSAQPMHSYWDGFFCIRGLHDATEIARVLGRHDLELKFNRLREAYQKCQYDSMRLCMQTHKIDYIPGCAELGDFDATSTAIGIYPCGEMEIIPQPQLNNTFDKYWQFFCDRRDGKLDWKDYTPYELRIISAFLKLGKPERSHALIDFFMNDQRPHEWNHWGEVVYRDPKTPKYVGDMPHTWCGSEFLRGLRNMLMYEDEMRERLVVAAGLRPEWPREGDGVRVTDFPTQYGKLSYRARETGDSLTIEMSGEARPKGGFIVCNPTGRKATIVSVNGRAGVIDGDNRVKVEALPATVVFTLEAK